MSTPDVVAIGQRGANSRRNRFLPDVQVARCLDLASLDERGEPLLGEPYTNHGPVQVPKQFRI